MSNYSRYMHTQQVLSRVSAGQTHTMSLYELQQKHSVGTFMAAGCHETYLHT